MSAAMCPKCGTMHDLFTAVDGSIVCHVDRDAKVEAEVRERIARDIEALKHDIEWPEFHYESGLIAGIEQAARIARGGESE